VAVGRCRDHITFLNMHIDSLETCSDGIWSAYLTFTRYHQRESMAMVDMILVGFPMASECVQNNIRLSYMYGDPSEIISGSIITFY
jgi:hypothetical protein